MKNAFNKSLSNKSLRGDKKRKLFSHYDYSNFRITNRSFQPYYPQSKECSYHNFNDRRYQCTLAQDVCNAKCHIKLKVKTLLRSSECMHQCLLYLVLSTVNFHQNDTRTSECKILSIRQSAVLKVLYDFEYSAAPIILSNSRTRKRCACFMEMQCGNTVLDEDLP